MEPTFPKGTPVVYHLFDGKMWHDMDYGVFIDNLTNRRCIVKFKDGIKIVDKARLMKRDWVENIMACILKDPKFKSFLSNNPLWTTKD